MYEIGGSFSFDITNRTSKSGDSLCYIYPQIALGDTNIEKMQLLQSWFGGKITSKHTRAHQWMKKGNTVPSIVEPILPYAPFRESHIMAFQLWEMSDDIDEKRQLAQELHRINTQIPSFPDPAEYSDLITNPRFLAGCYFARGAVRESHNASRAFQPRVMFNSMNNHLLEAIHQIYGGHIQQNDENSTTLDINNWNANEMLNFIRPHLVYRDPAVEVFFS